MSAWIFACFPTFATVFIFVLLTIKPVETFGSPVNESVIEPKSAILLICLDNKSVIFEIIPLTTFVFKPKPSSTLAWTVELSVCIFCAITETLPCEFVFTFVSKNAFVFISASLILTAIATPILSPTVAIVFTTLKSFEALTALTFKFLALIIAPLKTLAFVSASNCDFKKVIWKLGIFLLPAISPKTEVGFFIFIHWEFCEAALIFTSLSAVIIAPE